MPMSQSSTFHDALNVTPSHPARPRIAAFVAASVLSFFFAGGTTANGQTPLSSLPAQSPVQSTASADSSTATAPTAGSERNPDSNSSTNAGNPTSFSLSSSQIIDI